MTEETEIIRNRVAESGLEAINLSHYLPQPSDQISLGISAFSGGEPIIREKIFRQNLKAFDFTVCKGKIVCLVQDLDCVVQPWVWMLLTAHLHPVAAWVTVGPWDAPNEAAYIFHRFSLDYPPERLKDRRLIFSGCGSLSSAPLLYARITAYVLPHVKSLMFGEACSAVPVFKAANR